MSHEDIYTIVMQIPAGRVSTYGRIAQLALNPRGARGVGWALAGLSPERAMRVPWWRVINAAGEISNARNAALQRDLLESEGVVFDSHGRVSLSRFLAELAPPDEI